MYFQKKYFIIFLQFLKLQGKGKHGAEEINFIDVHQDDQISNVRVTFLIQITDYEYTK